MIAREQLLLIQAALLYERSRLFVEAEGLKALTLASEVMDPTLRDAWDQHWADIGHNSERRLHVAMALRELSQ